MQTTTRYASAAVIDHFIGLSAVVEAREGRSIRPVGLTSRDIEEEALMRLARKGYDWSNALGTPRNAA